MIHNFSDAEAVAVAVARQVQKICEDAIAKRDTFHLILAGGSTPERCYQLLATVPLCWEKVHIYFGDERCLPIGDVGRNDTMAHAALLDHVAIPTSQIHAIPAHLGAEEGAAQYSSLLEEAPSADLLLLGMGEDGHTASLFPDNPALDDPRSAVAVFNAPKLPAARVSMGLFTLNRARKKIIMVTGSGKQSVLRAIQAGATFPVNLIDDAEWFLDAAAEGK